MEKNKNTCTSFPARLIPIEQRISKLYKNKLSEGSAENHFKNKNVTMSNIAYRYNLTAVLEKTFLFTKTILNRIGIPILPLLTPIW